MPVITLENYQHIMEQIKAGRFAAYDSSITYIVGDVVFYSNALYKCITAVTTAEEFDPNKWIETTLADAIKPVINEHTILI